MTIEVLKITCDDKDCREATGGFDYFVTEIRDGLYSSDADFCRRCGAGNTRIIGELNEYAKAYHASIGTEGVFDGGQS